MFTCQHPSLARARILIRHQLQLLAWGLIWLDLMSLSAAHLLPLPLPTPRKEIKHSQEMHLMALLILVQCQSLGEVTAGPSVCRVRQAHLLTGTGIQTRPRGDRAQGLHHCLGLCFFVLFSSGFIDVLLTN